MTDPSTLQYPFDSRSTGQPAATVLTIAQLRALSPGISGSVAVGGTSVVGDGGGGVFVWSATSTDVDDGVNTITPSSSPGIGRWKRVSGTQTVLGTSAAAVQAAHDALPAAGGTIIFPAAAFSFETSVNISKPVRLLLYGAQIAANPNTTTALFVVNGANLSIDGTDRGSSTITASPNGAIVTLQGTFSGNGLGIPHISIRRVSLYGGACVFDTSAVRTPPLVFNEGMIKFDECLIANFTSTALVFGTSVYYARVQDCQFRNNASSIFCGDNSDVTIHHNEFIQGSGVQVTVLGPDVVIDDNKFLGNGGSPSTAPDILCDPKINATEGYGWITNNKFGAENENFNARPRIQVFDAALTANICGPFIVRDNRFGGPGPRAIASISLTSNIVTVVMAAPHWMSTGATVGIAQVSNVAFNVKAASVTVVNGTTFTFPLTHADIGVITNSGVAQLLSGPAIQLKSPINRWGFFDNLFEQYGLIVDDSQPQPTTGLSPAPERRDTFGKNRFGRQFIKSPYDFGVTIFKNGGVHFEYVERQETEDGFGDWKPREAFQLINRVAASDDFTQSDWSKNGIAVSTGQTDSSGGATAQLWTRAGSVFEEWIGQAISTSNLGSRVVVRILAKAGTLDNLSCVLVDTTSSTVLGWEQVNLSSSWQWHEVVFNNANPAHAFELEFFPGAAEDVAAGTIVVEKILVCDNEYQTYVPTTHSGGAVLKADAGASFNREIMVSRLRASEFGPAGTAPTLGASSGFGTGPTLTVTGKDIAGKVNWTCGTSPSASGSVAVSFGKAFTGSAPVVVVSFEDTGGGGYIHAQVGSVTTSGFTIEWENVSVGVALPNGYAGKFSWFVVGQ